MIERPAVASSALSIVADLLRCQPAILLKIKVTPAPLDWIISSFADLSAAVTPLTYL
jgi:hypothetical protein